MSDNLKCHKSLITRRKFLKAGAYASYIGVGLTLSRLIHKEDEAEAIVPLLPIPVFIATIVITQESARKAFVQTTLSFVNKLEKAVSGAVALVYGDASSAIDPDSNNYYLASKQLKDNDKFQMLLLANNIEGTSYHNFEDIKPGKTTITCRPFEVPVGSGQKWMRAKTRTGESEPYSFSCHGRA